MNGGLGVAYVFAREFVGAEQPANEDTLSCGSRTCRAAYLAFSSVSLVDAAYRHANPGLAAYQPPPKTVVRYADSPWVPSSPIGLLPIRKQPNRRPRSQRQRCEEPRRDKEARGADKLAGRVPQRSSNQIRSGRLRFVPVNGSRPWI